MKIFCKYRVSCWKGEQNHRQRECEKQRTVFVLIWQTLSLTQQMLDLLKLNSLLEIDKTSCFDNTYSESCVHEWISFQITRYTRL